MKISLLTTDCSRGLESCCDFWIHVDQEVVYLGHFLISVIDMSLYPFCEIFLDNRIAYVDEPLLWTLLDL